MKASRFNSDALLGLIPLGALAFYALNVDSLPIFNRFGPLVLQVLLLFGVAGAAMIFARRRGTRRRTPPVRPMIAWLAALVFISALRAVSALDPEYAGIAFRLMLSTLAIVTTWLISARMLPDDGSWVFAIRLTVLALFTVACASVIMDPFIDLRARLAPSMVGSYEVSRAGGLFLQPNLAGLALTLLYAMLLPRVEPKVAAVCTLAVLLAVFLTFSRSAMICLTLVILISVLRGYLPARMTALLAGIMLALVGPSFFQGGIGEVFGIDQGSGFLRLTDARRFYGVDAFASDERASLASIAFDDFLKAPFWGRGLGYSWKWSNSQFAGLGTHNLYLRYMLEFGAFGALIWPLFLLAAYRMRNAALDRSWAMGISLSAAVAGLFSHNIPEQGCVLVTLVAILTLPVPTVALPSRHHSTRTA